jgi:hypothetical protein
MQLAILESPFAGPTQDIIDRNVAYARAGMRSCLTGGMATYASHLLYTQPGVLDDTVPAERTLGIEAGLAWGSRAEVSVITPDLGISGGMVWGIRRAISEGRPLLFRSLPEFRDSLAGSWSKADNRLIDIGLTAELQAKIRASLMDGHDHRIGPEILQAGPRPALPEMPLTIIESPSDGTTSAALDRNATYARAAMHDCLTLGSAPLAGHLLYAQPGLLDCDLPEERRLGLKSTQAWADRASLSAVYCDLGFSDGMLLGLAKAIDGQHSIVFRSLPSWRAALKPRWPGPDARLSRIGFSAALQEEIRGALLDAGEYPLTTPCQKPSTQHRPG